MPCLRRCQVRLGILLKVENRHGGGLPGVYCLDTRPQAAGLRLPLVVFWLVLIATVGLRLRLSSTCKGQLELLEHLLHAAISFVYY